MAELITRIKDTRCPICYADVVEQGIKREYDGRVMVHCNGQRWEWVKFACGFGMEWVPNFQAVETRGECRNDPTVLARRAAADRLILELCAVIHRAEGVSETDKLLIRDSFAWRKF